ncbi:hypothetical protein EPI10_032223 [Gossypium australe]|uniref:Uncharacterized protein n=1 Tax=Gossypium australe TaxID=47621 RepID=A0A5B6X2N0_9ROSI|nr:hypothetical protein EPI10_032223 [Gossypium australe]
MCELMDQKIDLRATRDQTKNDTVDKKLFNLAKLEPVTFEEATQEAEWRTSMKDEITMINKNKA